MNRVGEVAGAEAMEYFSHNAQSEHTFNRREVLSGWAAMDPQAALGWLKQQPADSQPAEFWGAVVRGAASSNTGMAMDLLSEIPDQLSEEVVRGTADGLIQTSGLEGAADLLAKSLGDLPAGSPPPRRLAYFYQELKERVDRMKWLSGSYPEMNARVPSLDALEERFSPPGTR